MNRPLMDSIASLLYFKSQRLLGARVEECYRELLDIERWPAERLRRLAEERLDRVLRHAVENIPFYRERVARRRSLSLADFPVLTKGDIRRHFRDLMTPELRREHEPGRAAGAGYSWIEVKSGGSTGVPTTVIHDREFRDHARAGRVFSQYLCGFPVGTPYFRLWGAMGDINQSRESFHKRAMSVLVRERVMNAFRMNDDDMRRYLAEINSTNLRHGMVYVDAMDQLAQFAERHGIAVRAIESVMAGAGTVTREARERIRRVFGARVHNQYGSRDCSCIATECDRGGHHIQSSLLRVEVVDDAGRTLPSGQTGRILVTLLFNSSFPIIRYEIGDVGALSDAACPCGRPFPMFDRVEGRTLEFLTTTSGGYVSPVYIRHLIGVVHNPGLIERFQLIQTGERDFTLRVQPAAARDADAWRETSGLILRDLKTVLGGDSRIDIEDVPRIEETATGKFLYTINELKRKGAASPHS